MPLMRCKSSNASSSVCILTVPLPSSLAPATCLFHPFEFFVGAELAPGARLRLPVNLHDVGREVEPPVVHASANAVGVHRHALFLKGADARGVESAAARDHDFHIAK